MRYDIHGSAHRRDAPGSGLAAQSSTLPYILGGDAGLRSSAGRPVWPVTDESELEALRSTVDLFDGRLKGMESVGRAKSAKTGTGAS